MSKFWSWFTGEARSVSVFTIVCMYYLKELEWIQLVIKRKDSIADSIAGELKVTSLCDKTLSLDRLLPYLSLLELFVSLARNVGSSFESKCL
jgi:hypothetical protein